MQALSCQSTGADLKFEGPQARVVCPPHCERENILAYGASIHPLRSAVCLAGIVDGTIPYHGGEMMVSRVKGLPAYVGKDVGYAVSLPVTNQPGEAFHMYPVDNIDFMGRNVPAMKKLSCADTFDSLHMKIPGEMRPVWCPGDCGAEGNLLGTSIFSPMSTVCRAAEHAAAVGSEGGHAIVVKGHGQPFYFGSKSGTTGASIDGPGSKDSYTVSLPVPDVMARVVKKDRHNYAAPSTDEKDTSQSAMMSPYASLLLQLSARAAPPGRGHSRRRKWEGFL